MVDSVNSQMSDIDFYDAVRQAVKSTQVLNYDVTLPAYFRKNPFIRGLASMLEPVTNQYLAAL